MAEGAGGELGTDVRWQPVQEEEKKRGVRLIPPRQQRQQLIHQSAGSDAGDMQKRQELSRQLPSGRSVFLQQTVLDQLIGIKSGVCESVHDVADVVEDVSGQLRQDIVPFVLSGDDSRSAENHLSLLKPLLRLIGVEQEQLDRNVGPGCTDGSSGHSGGGSIW